MDLVCLFAYLVIAVVGINYTMGIFRVLKHLKD